MFEKIKNICFYNRMKTNCRLSNQTQDRYVSNPKKKETESFAEVLRKLKGRE